ncbi:MAG: alpha/beta hydrolase [Lachnospiraceae bacterium]|nr:alpha/beta hydrolase [Lachnospiraceae bacterium]
MRDQKDNKDTGKQTQLEATIGMAIMDALPVLCFSASIALIASMYRSAIFLVGAILCIATGIGKVLWKLILALTHKDVPLLYRQFHYLMPAGFLLMIISLTVKRPSFSLIWKNLSSFPCNILFLIALAGFAAMGILAAKLNATDKKANWIEQIVNLIAELCILFAVLIIWYGSDYYHADTEQYLQSTETVQVTEINDGLFFDGRGTETALIFYPGAKVEYTAYAPIMMKLAQNGVDCFLLEMPYNMAIFGMSMAEDIMAENSYECWYISGHSLGGAMAASYAAGHTEELDGVILLAAYATKPLADLSVLALYGSEDGVLSMEKLENGRQYAEDYTEICIEGGNHAGFGCYGEQSGDGAASITQEDQWEQTVEAILEWIGCN